MYPTPRTAKGQGRSVQDRLELLEARQWQAPPRLAGVLSPVTDANEVAGTGTFWIASPRVGFPVATLNSPDPTQNYALEQHELDTGTRYQIASRIGSPASQIYTERHTRTRSVAGVWTPWSVLSLPTKSFTPVAAGALVLGNGSISGSYSVADGLLKGRIVVVWGSTTAMSGNDIQFEHPPIPYVGGTMVAGTARITDASANINYYGSVLANNSRLYLRPLGTTEVGAAGVIFTREFSASATVPFVWASGDSFGVDFEYPIL
ncbi:hypothetical protein SEA_BABYDOTZ_39 [Microbacterium phage BabyDotz]|nr:hypothetical protein SEA_BABYDOTZ_39 [Microbacterium phage BabyDotz]